VTTAVVAIGWGLLLTTVGVVIPEPRPIWLAPFW
jgi:hypothetical protein